MTITLTQQMIIGEGRDRVCYRHPSVKSLCIKIPKRPEKQTQRERLYFTLARYLKKNTRHLSIYKGMAETNLGRGALFELVLNNDGSVSSTLKSLIERQLISKKELASLLVDLQQYLDIHTICLRDLSPNNIVVQENGHIKKLVIIDGVSNPGINPLIFFVPFLIRLNTRRRWKDLEKKVNKAFVKAAESCSV